MKMKPSPLFYLTMFFVTVVTMLMHEVVHWTTGTILGYEMYFTLTKAGVVEGGWRSELDYALVSIAGPIFTVAMGFIGAWLAIRKSMAFGYELIFVTFMQRFLAMVMSAISIPNDEARVSLFLGFEWWVIPMLVVLPLLGLTIWSSKALKYGFLVNFLCYVTVSIAFTVMVYADGQLAGFTGPSILDPFLPEQVRQPG